METSYYENSIPDNVKFLKSDENFLMVTLFWTITFTVLTYFIFLAFIGHYPYEEDSDEEEEDSEEEDSDQEEDSKESVVKELTGGWQKVNLNSEEIVNKEEKVSKLGWFGGYI